MYTKTKQSQRYITGNPLFYKLLSKKLRFNGVNCRLWKHTDTGKVIVISDNHNVFADQETVNAFLRILACEKMGLEY